MKPAQKPNIEGHTNEAAGRDRGMTATPTERVRKYRAAKKLKGIDVSEEALNKLRAYQARWELPSLSTAIEHAVVFSRPE